MRRMALGAIVVVLMLVSACASSEQAGDTSPSDRPAPTRGGSIAYALDADPNGFSPTRNAWDTAGLVVAMALYDPWVAFAADGTPKPYLAASFDHDDSYKTWTITLRDGVVFSDGTPLTAEVAKANLDALRASDVTGFPLGNIDAVTVLDAKRVQVTMVRPWASFLSMLTGQVGVVTLPELLDSPEGSTDPVGTGPFKLASWDIDRSTEVERNERYWRPGLPYLERVTFQVVPDGKDRVARLAAGDVDMAAVAQAGDVAEMDALAGKGVEVVHDTGAAEATLVMFNTGKAPFDDLSMRQAAVAATDIEALAAAGGWPPEQMANGPFMRSSPWFTETVYPPFDPARARTLVEQYEATHGPVEVTLVGSYAREVVQLVADQWNAVGITTKVDFQDAKRFPISMVAGLYDAAYLYYFGAPDPDQLRHFWSSSTVRPVGAISINMARFSDEVTDQALEDGRAVSDLTARRSAYAKVQARFAEQVPFLWLYHVRWTFGYRTGVHDARNVTLPDGSEAMPYVVGVHNLTETWVQGATG